MDIGILHLIGYVKILGKGKNNTNFVCGQRIMKLVFVLRFLCQNQKSHEQKVHREMYIAFKCKVKMGPKWSVAEMPFLTSRWGPCSLTFNGQMKPQRWPISPWSCLWLLVFPVLVSGLDSVKPLRSLQASWFFFVIVPQKPCHRVIFHTYIIYPIKSYHIISASSHFCTKAYRDDFRSHFLNR